MKLIEGIDYRKISRGKWKYELLRDLTVGIGLDGLIFITTPYFEYDVYKGLIIKKFYAWDGASGPAIDTDTVLRASLAHDAVCQAYDMELIDDYARKSSDRMFRDICLEDGMYPFRAWYMYRSVRMWSKLTRMKGKYK